MAVDEVSGITMPVKILVWLVFSSLAASISSSETLLMPESSTRKL